MSGQRLYRTFIDHWWMPLLGAVVAATIGAAVTVRLPATYESTALLVLSPDVPAELVDTEEGLQIVGEGLDALSANGGVLVNTFADLVSSPRVAADAAERVAMAVNEQERYSISGDRVPESNVVQLVVSGPDAGRATEYAAALSRVAPATFSDLYQVVAVDVIRPAEAPDGPAGAGPIGVATIAAVLGAAAGFGLALLRDAAGSRPDAVGYVGGVRDGEPTTAAHRQPSPGGLDYRAGVR